MMHRTMITIAALAALPVAALAQATTTHFVTLNNNDMLSSNVVGVDVYDNANHDLGSIKDVAFDTTKTVKGYILSVGGFLAWDALRRGRCRIRSRSNMIRATRSGTRT